ncbi:MAG TPA: hypothetical protein VN999_01035 [Thermoanaerobaculia bacterium]|nr:hypothetical protein [Thermoanaerobaculia bacterium]
MGSFLTWMLYLMTTPGPPQGGDPPFPDRMLWVGRLAGIGVAAVVIMIRAVLPAPTREEAAAWERGAPERAERELERLRREAELAAELERAAWNYRCPECKMQIHRDARICPYCRSRFA